MEELAEFRRRLEDYFPSLTKSEQRIASYLLANYDEATFLPAAELAQRLDVSEATVVRFARSIGYDGFPELRRALQGIFRIKVTPATRLQHKLAELGSSPGHVLTKMVDMEVQYLAEALHSVQPADFDRAVEIILSAKRLFVFGTGPSRILADLVLIRLRRFGIPVITMTESGRDILEELQLMQPQDVVLATGFHRITGELAAVMDHARSLGCRIVFITDTLGPHFKNKADVILSALRGPVSTFHSLAVPMTILNALILAVAMARPEESLAALDRLQQMRAAYGLDYLANSK
jgi:DNA-binding MurR/RpiR family transcriptional regulator